MSPQSVAGGRCSGVRPDQGVRSNSLPKVELANGRPESELDPGASGEGRNTLHPEEPRRLRVNDRGTYGDWGQSGPHFADDGSALPRRFFEGSCGCRRARLGGPRRCGTRAPALDWRGTLKLTSVQMLGGGAVGGCRHSLRSSGRHVWVRRHRPRADRPSAAAVRRLGSRGPVVGPCFLRGRLGVAGDAGFMP